MPVDVSVVIPFFNAAANIEDCLSSMVAQTLDPARYEIVLVDDGSTDSTPSRVAAWAARYPALFSVRRIEATGWPGTPRNVGIDVARGRYVQFVDSDDSLAPRALERLVEIADESAADVVVGKIASDFRGLHHPLFRATVTHRTLADYPLANNLTVCKMFRREFLLNHEIRFAAGPRHVEDQHICIQAYVHATSVAVVSDLTCYFYRRRRTGGRNLGDTLLVPAEYYRDLGYVLDVVDRPETEPAGRRSVQQRLYRTEMLGRLRGGAMLGYSPAYRQEMVDEVRRLATRIPADVHDNLPAFIRVQSRLVASGDVAALLGYAEALQTIRFAVEPSAARWEAGRLVIAIAAQLRIGDDPLRLEPDGAAWLLPTAMAPGLGTDDRRLSEPLDVDLDVASVAKADSQLWSTAGQLTLAIGADGVPRVTGEAVIDPATVIAGGGLTPGLWDVRLRFRLEGLSRAMGLPLARDAESATWIYGPPTSLSSVRTYRSESGGLSLDVAEWTHPLDELLEQPPVIDSGRSLQLAVGRIRGASGTRRSGELVLVPAAGSPGRPIRCDAELVLTPGGSVLQCALPRLPRRTGWDVWVRFGELGAAAPRQLPWQVTSGRFGKLSVDVGIG
jgi:glycosyltransferase involved in cell wall biosynthesis